MIKFALRYSREFASIRGFKITLPGPGGCSMRGNGGPEGDDGERGVGRKERKKKEEEIAGVPVG